MTGDQPISKRRTAGQQHPCPADPTRSDSRGHTMADAVPAQVRIGPCDLGARHEGMTRSSTWCPAGDKVLQPPMRRVAARWLRSSGTDATVQLRGFAMQSEPPHVSGLPVARIQWHRTVLSGFNGHNGTHISEGDLGRRWHAEEPEAIAAAATRAADRGWLCWAGHLVRTVAGTDSRTGSLQPDSGLRRVSDSGSTGAAPWPAGPGTVACQRAGVGLTGSGDGAGGCSPAPLSCGTRWKVMRLVRSGRSRGRACDRGYGRFCRSRSDSRAGVR